MCVYIYMYINIVYLKGKLTEEGNVILHSVVYFPNGYKGQSHAQPKPGARKDAGSASW